ncbi:hypothetical protein SAMN05661099_3105 [Daejeonella lutea]|uniref:Uncharacterized protein n=1 Tax=Daejeonella lutea TaxID=572036 RepID=A0A1T5EPT1_9SPHI|nr:hypothetical protein SAMN05661099_3105 [Daejeonella lutea]
MARNEVGGLMSDVGVGGKYFYNCIFTFSPDVANHQTSDFKLHIPASDIND